MKTMLVDENDIPERSYRLAESMRRLNLEAYTIKDDIINNLPKTTKDDFLKEKQTRRDYQYTDVLDSGETIQFLISLSRYISSGYSLHSVFPDTWGNRLVLRRLK